MEFDDDIPQLTTDGQNWSTWCKKVEKVIKSAGLYSYLDGTVSEPDRQLEAMAKLILTMGLPDSIFGSMLYLETTTNIWQIDSTNLQYNRYKNDYENSKDVVTQSHKWLHAHEKPLADPVGSAASTATRCTNAEQSVSSRK